MTAIERSELTRFVAEHAMGWTPVHEQYRPHCGCSMVYDQRQETLGMRFIGPACGMTLHDERDRWEPCTKIEHAWLLVDRMRELKYYLNYRERDNEHTAAFYRAGVIWDCMAWGQMATTLPRPSPWP